MMWWRRVELNVGGRWVRWFFTVMVDDVVVVDMRRWRGVMKWWSATDVGWRWVRWFFTAVVGGVVVVVTVWVHFLKSKKERA